MRPPRALVACCFVALSSFPVHVAGAQSTRQEDSGPAHTNRKQAGFFDYALDKVNPDGKDYGAKLQASRDALVDHSLDDLYFWSNAFTLLLLCGSAAVILLQWRSAEKREVIASSLIAELWNGRVSDRTEIERRTADFNRLVATHNADVEKALSSRTTSTEREKEAASNLDRNVRRITSKPLKPSEAVAVITSTAGEPGPASSGDGVDTSLKQSNILLQRQIEAMQNSEQNLKQRLNQTTLLLDQERRRNASLKGG